MNNMKVTKSRIPSRELVLKDFSKTKIAEINLSEHFTSDLRPSRRNSDIFEKKKRWQKVDLK